MSNNNSPIFPIPQSQHFSDYGFDPQIDYFQVLEEARKHKKENSLKSSIDSIHLPFKLQKPISKDDLFRTALHKKKKRWFWKNALLFFNWRKWPLSALGRRHGGDGDMEMDFDDRDVHMARARKLRASVGAGSISGPVYVTESRSGSSTPYQTIRPHSLTPAIPYLSLRELNMERQQRSGTSMSGPLYLVT